jgi:hypothetical protein
MENDMERKIIQEAWSDLWPLANSWILPLEEPKHLMEQARVRGIAATIVKTSPYAGAEAVLRADVELNGMRTSLVWEDNHRQYFLSADGQHFDKVGDVTSLLNEFIDRCPGPVPICNSLANLESVRSGLSTLRLESLSLMLKYIGSGHDDQNPLSDKSKESIERLIEIAGELPDKFFERIVVPPGDNGRAVLRALMDADLEPLWANGQDATTTREARELIGVAIKKFAIDPVSVYSKPLDSRWQVDFYRAIPKARIGFCISEQGGGLGKSSLFRPAQPGFWARARFVNDKRLFATPDGRH